MKTKELIKQVEELGYEVNIRNGEMRISWCGKECVCIELEHQFGIYIYSRNLGNNAHRLFAICMEYAKTPIDEREKEKKYYLRKKELEFYEATDKYLNFQVEEKFFGLLDESETDNYKTQFTQKEIDDIKERFNTDLEEFEQIEVEEN